MSTNLVVGVEAKGDKAAILVMSDGTRIWTPEKAKADELLQKPIPADWTRKEGDYGPQAFPPRGGGGRGAAPAAFRNTKEGQAIEQDHMDRRTALMQAVEYVLGRYGAQGTPDALVFADAFYLWLKNPAASTPSTQERQPAVPIRENEGAADARGGGGGLGEGAKPPASCTHPDIVLTKPDGSPLPHGYFRCAACGAVKKEAS